jgi:hypothetical protein
MNFKSFCENEKIPYLPFYYFISDVINEDGSLKKIPIKEKNNLKPDEIENELINRQNIFRSKPFSYSKKDKDDKYININLSETEIETLTQSYTIFLKHHPEYYCIDIDERNINSMDDYINVLNKNNVDESIIDNIKQCSWVKGNTKGIHIYIKLLNVPKYSNQQNVFKFIEGDFIKTNNMWEGIKKQINYNNHNPIEFNIIKPLFKSEQLNPVEKPKTIKEVKQEIRPSVKQETNISNNDEIKKYIDLCIENNIFQEVKGYTNWLSIGLLIKNSFGDDGIELFNKISSLMPKYDGEQECNQFYNDLNRRIFNQDKKPITLGTLKYIVKETNKNIYDKINSLNIENTNKFNRNYFNSLTSYDLKKQYFELFVCKVLRPQPIFIYNENDVISEDNKKMAKIDKNSLLYKENEIKEAFRELKSSIIKKTSKTDEGKETKFINEWLDDPNMKVYNKMDFIPFNGITNNKKSEYYNLFNGYNNLINTEFNLDKKELILKPFKELLFEQVGADKECYDYFYNFLGHLIQKPSERIPICFIFKSKQGVGKNVMLDAIGNLIGKSHYITSSNPNDFFGDYSEGFYRKLLVNINECEGKDTFDFEGKIKSFITENTLTLNPKFIRQTTISNYARLIIFTNKPNPIPIDVRSKDRRFVVYQSTEKYLDKKYVDTFWTKLVEHFRKPEFIACLYNDLNSLKIDNVKWSNRPITEAYLEMCKIHVPIEALFLEYYIDNMVYTEPIDEYEDFYTKEDYNKIIDVPTTNLYKNYVDYCSKFGFKKDNSYQPDIKKFISKINELELDISKVKTNKCMIFRLCLKTIYTKMGERNWIIKDEDENNNENLIEELKENEEDNFKDYFTV